MANKNSSVNIAPICEFDNKAACALLGITPKTMARLRKLDLIRAAKIGGFWFYKREWIDAYIDSVTFGRSE